MALSAVHATLIYLRACQQARAAGHRVAYVTDPAWLVQIAINRRAGWPDDPTCHRGSCFPVAGRFPRKGGGDWYAHLCQRAREINSRAVVRLAQLGEHRWLMRRLPHRITQES